MKNGLGKLVFSNYFNYHQWFPNFFQTVGLHSFLIDSSIWLLSLMWWEIRAWLWDAINVDHWTLTRLTRCNSRHRWTLYGFHHCCWVSCAVSVEELVGFSCFVFEGVVEVAFWCGIWGWTSWTGSEDSLVDSRSCVISSASSADSDCSSSDLIASYLGLWRSLVLCMRRVWVFGHS